MKPLSIPEMTDAALRAATLAAARHFGLERVEVHPIARDRAIAIAADVGASIIVTVADDGTTTVEAS